MPFNATYRSPIDAGDPTRRVVAGPKRRARAQVLAACVGLVAVAIVLPSPHATLDALVDARPAAAGGDVADAAMVEVAALAVWMLVAWVVLVGTAAVAGRLPGTLGSAGRAVLVAVAPGAVRNVLLTVVGTSVVTGLAGCTTVSAGPDQSFPAATAAAAPSGAAQTDAGSLAARAGSAGVRFDTAAMCTPAPQHLAAPRVGIATLGGPDQIAFEGSAVRSGRAATADNGSPAPSVDWPATGVGSGTADPAPASAAASAAPTTTAAARAAAPASVPPGAGPAARSGRTTRAAPTVSVDWPAPATRGTSAVDGSVVVLRGDSLWSIAARSLPAGTDDAAIDRTWRAWYAANTSVIGSDPNHILPGQILLPPNTETVAP